MKFSPYLKQIALLGSAKRHVDLSQLDEPIVELLKEKEYNDPEELLLDALSLDFHFKHAGNLPYEYTGEWNHEPIKEDKDVIPEKLQEVLHEIMVIEGNLMKNLILDWIDLIVEKNSIVPANQIIPLIRLASKSSVDTKLKIMQIIGNKGAWIMKQHPDFSFTISKDDTITIWEEGSIKQRKEFLLKIIAMSRPQALALVESTWSQESIRNKLSFLNILRANAQDDEIPFFEKLYYEDFKYFDKEKKMVREGREILAMILLGLNNSKLNKELFNGLSKYLIVKKKSGFLSKVFAKDSISFELPQQDDEFFNAANMSKTFEIDNTATDMAVFKNDQLFWFSRFVSAVPLKQWSLFFGKSENEVLDFFTKHQQFLSKYKGKEYSKLMKSLLSMAKLFKEDSVVLHLISFYKESEPNIIELLQLLKPDIWERVIINSELYINSRFLNTFPADNRDMWSDNFSHKLINAVVNKIKENSIYDYNLGTTVAKYLNLNSLTFLERIHNNQAQSLNQFNWWNKHFYQPIHTSLKIKSLLKSFK